jgi:hypothetical protein
MPLGRRTRLGACELALPTAELLVQADVGVGAIALAQNHKRLVVERRLAAGCW